MKRSVESGTWARQGWCFQEDRETFGWGDLIQDGGFLGATLHEVNPSEPHGNGASEDEGAMNSVQEAFVPGRRHDFGDESRDEFWSDFGGAGQEDCHKSCQDRALGEAEQDHQASGQARDQARDQNKVQPTNQTQETLPKQASLGPQIFLDTADVHQLRAAQETGFISGVTTNPSLVSALGASSVEDLCRPILDLGLESVSIQVTAQEWAGMVQQGRLFASWGTSAVVKVPLTRDGLRACQVLSGEGIRVNVTLCFSVPQCLLAAKAGATYISLFVGRLEDHSQEPYFMPAMTTLQQAKAVCAQFTRPGCSGPKILAASIRNLHHVSLALHAQADVLTMPPKVFDQMFTHVLTEGGLSTFVKDGQNILISCP